MRTEFIRSSQKRDILKKLEKQFGISELNYLLIQAGREKIRGYSGHLSKDEIVDIGKLANVETVGLYVLKEEKDKLIRLSTDACHLLKKQITKNIITLNDEQFSLWIRGNDVDIEIPSGVHVIVYDNIPFGCTVSNGKKLFNYLPKDRRLRR